MSYNIEDLEIKIQNILPKKRFLHTTGVRYTCAALAMKYNYDIEKAQIAGLLHDCAKYMKSEEILLKCEELNLPVSEFERKAPQVLHGRLGAYYAKNLYNIDDEEILHAIEFHTTGSVQMSILDKILYIADYIEPNRKNIRGLEDVRKMAFVNLDKAILCKIQNVFDYLNSKEQQNKSIDPLTYDVYNYYKEQIGDEC